MSLNRSFFQLLRFTSNNYSHVPAFIIPVGNNSSVRIHTGCSYKAKENIPWVNDTSTAVKPSLADVDITSFQVKYDKVPHSLLQDLDDRVKKLLTVEYGTEKDVCDGAYRMLIDECGFSACEKTPETRIIDITIDIWRLRNRYRQRKTKHNFYDKIVKLVDIRRNLLDHVRNYNFENYYRIMTVLNHHHYFKPEVFMVKSPLAENVKEMKIRAYAHSLNVAQKEADKQNYFNELKEKFLQDLKSKELVEHKPETMSHSDQNSRSFG